LIKTKLDCKLAPLLLLRFAQYVSACCLCLLKPTNVNDDVCLCLCLSVCLSVLFVLQLLKALIDLESSLLVCRCTIC